MARRAEAAGFATVAEAIGTDAPADRAGAGV
jgi:hypothetical protein